MDRRGFLKRLGIGVAATPLIPHIKNVDQGPVPHTPDRDNYRVGFDASGLEDMMFYEIQLIDKNGITYRRKTHVPVANGRQVVTFKVSKPSKGPYEVRVRGIDEYGRKSKWTT